MKIPTWHVEAKSAGKSLFDVLSRWAACDGEPQSLVRGRRVQVNGNICLEPELTLKSGDVIRLLPHAIAPPPTVDDVRIRFLDSHLLVVEKPSGMTTMRYGDEVSASGRRDKSPTLLDLLPRILARSPLQSHSSAGRTTHRKPTPGRLQARRTFRETIYPVHRLDRETSGLLVFARTAACERELTQLFREHDFERCYLAVVLGRIESQTIESILGDDRGDGRRGSVQNPGLGKRAVTHVAFKESLGGYSLVECRLETGRTHQIRIHLSERGHPLCGDRQYRSPLGERPKPDESRASRLMLHSAELEFQHPMTNQRIRVESPLPREFAQFVKHLRRKHSTDGKDSA